MTTRMGKTSWFDRAIALFISLAILITSIGGIAPDRPAISLQASSTSEEVIGILKELVDNNGYTFVGNGSWTQKNAKYRDPLKYILPGVTASDHDLRPLITKGTSTAKTISQWKDAARDIKLLVNARFPNPADADRVLASINLYPPSELMVGVKNNKEALERFTKLGMVPNLGMKGPIANMDPFKAVGGVYGEGSLAEIAYREKNFGMIIYKEGSEVITKKPTESLMRHFGSTLLQPFTSKGKASVAMEYSKFAQYFASQGDSKMTGKYLERLTEYLQKARELGGFEESAQMKELQNLGKQLGSGKATLSEVGTRVDQLIVHAQRQSTIVQKAATGSKAQKQMMGKLLTELEKSESKVGAALKEAIEKIGLDRLLHAIILVFVTADTADAAGKGDYKGVWVNSVFLLESLSPGILALLTNWVIEAAIDSGYSFAAARQRCDDLLAGIFTAEGRAEADVTAYTMDGLYNKFKTPEKLEVFLEARSHQAADRGFKGPATEDADWNTGDKIYEKCYPVIFKAWSERREIRESELNEHLDQMVGPSCVLEADQNPVMLGTDGKATVTVSGSLPGGVQTDEVESAKRIIKDLTGAYGRVNEKIQITTLGGKMIDGSTYQYTFDYPGTYTISAKLVIEAASLDQKNRNAASWKKESVCRTNIQVLPYQEKQPCGGGINLKSSIDTKIQKITAGGGATGGTFPAEPFNGMQIIYQVSGVKVLDQEDHYDFTTYRAFSGGFGTGDLHLTGTVLMGGGYGAGVSASISVDGESRNWSDYVESGYPSFNRKSFDLTLPIPKEAETVSFSINMSGEYNAGGRGLIVSGTFELQQLAKGSANLGFGDRVRTGSRGTAVFSIPPGVELKLLSNSDLEVVKATESDPDSPCQELAIKLNKGKITYNGKTFKAEDVPILNLGKFKVKPKGTLFQAEVGETEENLKVSVVDGVVEITDGENTTTVETGSEIVYPEAKSAPFDLSSFDGDPIGGIPFEKASVSDDLPYADDIAVIDFSEEALGEDWSWEAPDPEAKMNISGDETMIITVPAGDSFENEKTNAPRLLHRVTGDFDLEAEVLSKAVTDNQGIVEFMIKSPGSMVGADYYQKATGLLDSGDYLKMGGGWWQTNGKGYLDCYREDHSRDGVSTCPAPGEDFVSFRLRRQGEIWSTYWSKDGVTWNLVSQKKLDLPETIFAGLVFRRVTSDNDTKPLEFQLRAMRLDSSPLGTFNPLDWAIAQNGGIVDPGTKEVTLSMDGSKPGMTTALYQSGEQLEGDFDFSVYYNLDAWEGKAEEHPRIFLWANSPSISQGIGVLMGMVQRGTEKPAFYSARVNFNGESREIYEEWVTPGNIGTSGKLRLVRLGKTLQAYYWEKNHWAFLREFADPNISPYAYSDPMMIALVADNTRGTKPAELKVDFMVEKILTGEFVETLDKTALFEEIDLPDSIKIPEGYKATLYQAPFNLSTFFFDKEGTTYIFPLDALQKSLIAYKDGMASKFLESDVFGGITGKVGVWLGENILVGVDCWPESGNKYRGLIEIDPKGEKTEWALPTNPPGLCDLIEAPDKGWYYSDFELDNIYHLPEKGVAEKPLITQRDIPKGLCGLAYDDETKALYALNIGTKTWPFDGDATLYRLNEDGSLTTVAAQKEPESVYRDIALTTGDRFGHAFYVTDMAHGKILKISSAGEIEEFITGLVNPAFIGYNPVLDTLDVVLDNNRFLKIEKK